MPANDAYAHRQDVGRLGEELAARFLEARGARVLGRNVRVGRGEIDLHVAVGGVSVAVEVKTLVASPDHTDALEQFSAHKARTVRRYARMLSPPAHRVDLIAVTLRGEGAELRWVAFAG